MDKKPTGKGRGRVEREKEPPVAYKKSILAAFARQNSGRKCPVCDGQIAIAEYRSHLDECRAPAGDDCQVICSYTKEQAILLRAGSPVVLDENDSTESPQPKRTRRSKRLVVVEELEVKVEKEEEVQLSQVSPLIDPSELFREEEDEPQPSTSFSLQPPEVSTLRKRRSSPKTFDGARVKDEVITAQKLVEMIDRLTPKEGGKKGRKEDPALADEPEEAVLANSPYFVTFALRIMRRVLTTRRSDGRLYDEKFWLNSDLRMMSKFLHFSQSARQLFLRLFLRKPQWLSVEKLKQRYSTLANIDEIIDELIKCGFLDSDTSLKSLEEALEISDSHVLRKVSKKYKLDYNKGKIELSKALTTFASSQKSIFGTTGSVALGMLKELKVEIGKVVRVQKDVILFFKVLMTLYAPTETNSALVVDSARYHVYQELLFTMLQVENGSILLPAPRPCPSIISIYETRENLFNYVSAKELETRILVATALGKVEEAFAMACDARQNLISCSPQIKSDLSNLPIHTRKFTMAWVLMRCCGHGSSVLEKQKKYSMAVEWQRFLLLSDELRSFCPDNRGVWWDRMTLNLDAHLKDRDEAGDMLKLAMDDPLLMDKERLMLQDRAERTLKGDYDKKINIDSPRKVIIKAPTLTKNLGDARVNRFMIRDGSSEVECSVEEVVRRRYMQNEGFSTGVHDEGASWHTVFGTIFYDVIFDWKLEDAWLSELQSCPTDMNYSLYERRETAFKERFEWLAVAEVEGLRELIEETWETRSRESNRECAWTIFETPQNLLDFITCVPRDALCAVLQRMARNYRNCRSGFPDLTLWDAEKKIVAVVEVKGPGDKLSTKQRLWLDYFSRHGIRAEVCHVVAENTKRIG